MSNEEKGYLIYLAERELKSAMYNFTNAAKNKSTPPDQMENLVKKLKAKQQMVRIVTYLVDHGELDRILED